MRSTSFRRHQRFTHIRRKIRVLKHKEFFYYKYDGQLNKGKIHCSCPLCSTKTNHIGYKISDRRKLDRLNYVD